MKKLLLLPLLLLFALPSLQAQEVVTVERVKDRITVHYTDRSESVEIEDSGPNYTQYQRWDKPNEAWESGSQRLNQVLTELVAKGFQVVASHGIIDGDNTFNGHTEGSHYTLVKQKEE